MKVGIDSRKNLKLLSYLFYAGGILFILLTPGERRRDQEYFDNLVVTKGVVIEKLDETITLGAPQYFAVVELSDESGVLHRSRSLLLPHEFRTLGVGDTVRISYNRRNPSRCNVGETIGRSDWIIVPVVGALFILIGIGWRLLVSVFPLPEAADTNKTDRN